MTVEELGPFVRSWLAEAMRPAPGHQVPSDAAFRDFVGWLSGQIGLSAEQVTPTLFGRAMAGSEVVRGRTSDARFYCDVELV